MAVKTIAFMLPWVDPLSANSNLYNAGVIARIETSIADRAITAGKALEINANIFDQQLNTTDSPTFAGLTVDTNTLFVDAVNNRVGIGTASPGQALDVSGITQATRFYVTDGNAVIERSSGALNIQTYAGNNILLNPGGNVGIGTTSPSQRLDVSGGNIQIEASTTGSTYLFFTNETSGERGRIHTDNAGVLTQQASAGTFLFRSPSSEFMRINALGNIGMGTTAPEARLHVNSGPTNLVAKFESTDATVTLAMVDNTTTTTGNGPNVLVRTGDTTSIYAGGTERITILGAGNVGIGTGSPSAKLHVNGNARVGSVAANTSEVGLVSTGSNTYAAGLQVRNYSAAGWARMDWYHQSADNPALLYQISNGSLYFRNDSTASTPFLWNVGSTTAMVLNSSGNVGIGTTGPSAKLHVNGTVRLQNLPTSSSGLSSGDLWNDGGTLKIA